MSAKAVPPAKYGLLPTPPMPRGLPKVELTENARQVLMKRYVRRGDDGKPVETVEEMFWRVAWHVAKAEETWNGDIHARAVEFYHLLTSKKFFPNSPTFTGAGTPLGQLAACFTGAMRVTTSQGVKRIDQLEIGDRVLTHAGHFRPVTHLFQRAYNAELLRIKVKLIGTTLEVTPEHPILTENGWVKAGDLRVGDRVAIGCPKGISAPPRFDLAALEYADELELQESGLSIRAHRPGSYQNSGRQAEWVSRYIDVTPDLARLCGYYVAEGSIGPDERYVRFVFAKDEGEYHEDVVRLVKEIFGAPVNQSDSSFGNWVSINIYSRPVAAWFRSHFGHGSTKKRIPVWLQFAEKETQEAFLVGLMRGDGLYFERTYSIASRPNPKVFRSLRLTLSNPGLVQQIWQMCLRLGYDAAIRPVDTTYATLNASETAQISMPPLQSRELVKEAYGIDLPAPDERYIRNAVVRDGEQVYFPIESISSQFFNGVVYNCEVDEDHTYVTEGVVVHNCFVLPISDDMGRDSAGIFQTLRDAALIQQTGGGNGFSFSRLRPKGALVKSSAGQATGPVGFLRVYDHAFGEIAQGGTRRGANMAVLRVDHPDIEEFVTCKTDENSITNFNISVGITDAFMRAVKNDEEWELRFPDIAAPQYRGWHGTLEQAEAAGVPIRSYGRVRARDLFDKIVKQAHHNGEPGVLFLDAANRSNPVPHLYPLEATNPCVTGETLVATPSGWRRADTIKEGDEICTVLGVGRVATIEINENVPVYDLHLSDGASIRVTASHQFHARDSRTKFFVPRRLDELKIGDWVRVYRSMVPNNPVPGKMENITDREYGFLIGVLVGDGCYTPHALSKNVVRISTHAGEAEWNSLLAAVFAKVGAEKMYTYINEGSRSMMMDPKPGRVVADWVKSLPLEPARGPEKRLPEAYINSNRDFLLGLLDGLFSTDGSVDLQSNHPLIRFHTSSLELARQLRRILLMFGIYGRISKTHRASHSIDGRRIRNDRPKYDVLVSGASFGSFFEQIRLSHPQKQARLEEAALRSNFTGGNWAAKVVKIVPAGVATVYDLYEPKSDTWITEGFVSRGCGEQWLGPYENCCLGSINLNEHCGPEGTVDWETLRQSVVTATRFLDDVVEANAYVPAVPQLKEAAHRARRIGLGIMGLADLMYHAGVRYGSKEGQEFAAQVMEFVRYHAMKTSVELAKGRGPFPAIEGSIYDPGNLKWTPPQPLTPYQHDWGRPKVEWETIVDGIRKHGIRNAAQCTVAPTGTIATVAGCEGYGCEPVFALAYIRHVNDNGKDLKLSYASPRFDEALKKLGLGEEKRQEIVERVMAEGSCQRIMELPQSVRDTFVVSADITAEEHVRMQAALQAFVDNSMSKTVNFPETATEHDVANAYMLAWELGCKGITVYVTGSREKVVLETKATAEKKSPPAASAPASPAIWHETKKPRPRALAGRTYNVETPVGKAFITINENGGGQPFEAFINTSKAGSETAAVSEAIGRLISYILRMASPVLPTDRMREIVRQLTGIGGGRPLGFGPNRVRSLPDGIGQVLAHYLREKEGAAPDPLEEKSGGNGGHLSIEEEAAQNVPMRIGDLCPECGEAAVVNEEGCRKCYACGYSEC